MRQEIKDKLIELGFTEIRPNLWRKDMLTYTIYHDYRKGYRWSYGFNHDSDIIDIKNKEEYKAIKRIDMAQGCKRLDEFKK